MNKHGLISIVIITKDTKELLRGLLNSIKNDLSLQPYIGKIIIIDNASADATEEMIREEFPAVVYVKNERNMGFAFSANKGASLAEDEYILFLNSDTVLMQGELEKMVRFMNNNANVAICGPQFIYPDMKLQRSFAAVPSLARELFPHRGFKVQGREAANRKSEIVNGIGKRTKGSESDSGLPIHDSRFTIHDQDPPLNFPTPGSLSSSPIYDLRFPISGVKDVDSLIGAALLVKREVLKALNGFDEKFFFFLEETDLCVRVCQAGHRIVFFPEARVIHLQGKTVHKNWISGRIEYNISLHKFIKKHHTPIYYGTFVAVRFTKALFLAALFPLIFFGQRMRMKYAYYLRLISWYFRSCPDNVGLRPAKDVQRERQIIARG